MSEWMYIWIWKQGRIVHMYSMYSVYKVDYRGAAAPKK